MKRILKLILLLLAAAVLLSGTAWAEEDPVDQFAQQFAQFEPVITVPVREFDVLMEETFTRYPELYLYYNGGSHRSVPEGLELNFNYRNTDIARGDCYVIHSREQLMAAMGLTMADLETHFEYVIAPDFQITDEDYQESFLQLEDDYYMVKMGYFSYNGSTSYNEFGDATITYGTMDFYFWDGLDASTVAQWRNETEEAVMNAASTLFAQDMPDYQKELIIHDYLVDNNRYDTLYMDDSVNHLAYSALVQGKTVCQGYSEAAELLLKAAGVPSRRVDGTGNGEAHSWNCVQIGGEWYMLDITWDDPAAEDGSDLGIKQYDYFNITSDQLAQDHNWETGEYPGCTAAGMNYDAVRAAVDADTNTYSNYSTDLVETQEKDRAALLALLGDPAEAEPAATAEEPAEAADTAEPEGDSSADTSGEPDPADSSAEPGDSSADPADASGAPGDSSADPADNSSDPADSSVDPANPSADPDADADQADPDLLQRLDVVTIDDNKVTKETKGFTVGKLVLILVILALSVGVIVLIIHLNMLRRVSDARADRRVRRERKVTMMLDRRRSRVSSR